MGKTYRYARKIELYDPPKVIYRAGIPVKITTKAMVKSLRKNAVAAGEGCKPCERRQKSLFNQ